MEVTEMVGSALRNGFVWGTNRIQQLLTRTDVDGPRPCDGLVLDIDDTLIDTESAIRAGAHTAAIDLWPESTTRVRERFATLFHSDEGGHFAAYTRGDLQFHEMRKLRIASSAEAVGLHWEGKRYRRFCAAYDPAFAAAQRLYPDALPAIDVVRRWGIAVVLLTNSSTPATRMKLQVLGVADLFPDVVTTDTLGIGKPDPRVFVFACATVGLDPAQCVGVGDHFDNDVQGARKAGLRALWLDRSRASRPDRAPSIHSLESLPAALQHAI